MKRAHWSTWYTGTETAWRELSIGAREDIAFHATGCVAAYPTWTLPVDCLHGPCRVRRREIHPMILVNGTLKYEAQSGWLRFASRERKARVFRAVRTFCRERGIYDAWKAWPLIVYGGVSE